LRFPKFEVICDASRSFHLCHRNNYANDKYPDRESVEALVQIRGKCILDVCFFCKLWMQKQNKFVEFCIVHLVHWQLYSF